MDSERIEKAWQDANRKKERRDLVRPPRLRTITAVPRGPRMYALKEGHYKGPLTEPPPGFVSATTSASEWVLYWAMFKALDIPADPRMPPFMGYPPIFYYQSEQFGGRQMAGGAVVDYVIQGGAKTSQNIGIRLVTERFHIYNGEDVHWHDTNQLWRLSERMRIIDIYDQDFLPDKTGAAAVALIKDGIAGRTTPNPMTDGTTQRVTRMKWTTAT